MRSITSTFSRNKPAKFAAMALALAVAGGLAKWLDQPLRVHVPAGLSDVGLYAVEPLLAEDRRSIEGRHGEILSPVARFETRGRVLHLERFSTGKSLSNWVPIMRSSTHDIGLGYGPMTDSANVELFTYSHDGANSPFGGIRFLNWTPRGEEGHRRWRDLAPHITNVHAIPASREVESAIERLKIGELVTLRGLLVNVRTANGAEARTSVTAGDRDCEILWVTHLEARRMY